MVAHQRKATAGKLHPDLMASAGMQTDLHQTFFSGGNSLKFQPGWLYAGSLFFDHKNLVFAAVFK